MTELFTGRRADEKIRGRGGVSVEFDCWTGLQIENKYFTIVEKINYKEKNSNDCWTEYGLVADPGKERWWLSVMDGGLHCTLSRSVSRVTPPKGYHLYERGVEVIKGVWGDSEASVGEEASYSEYESADGNDTFFLEVWAGEQRGAAGRHIDKAAIRPHDTAASLVRAQELKRLHRKKRLWRYGIGALWIAVCLFVVTWLEGDFSWHGVRRFVNLPYTMEERLSDAPYYTRVKATDEGSVRSYETSLDFGAVTLDLIEAVDGWTKDIRQDIRGEERRVIISTAEEICAVTQTPERKTRIRIGSAKTSASAIIEGGAEPASEEERLAGPARVSTTEQDLTGTDTLERYAALVRNANTRGRTAVVLEKNRR